MTTKHLGELNTMRFFCQCGQGQAGKCFGYHINPELSRPGSTARHYLIVTSLGLAIVAVMVIAAVLARWF